MKRLMMIATFLCFSYVVFATTHFVNPKIDPNQKTRIIIGNEVLPMDALGDRLPEPPPMTDTIGNVFRAGRTWYDCQHNGTVGRMLEIDTITNTVHMVYMRGIDSLATNRQVFYNLFDPSTNTMLFGQAGQRVPPSTVSRSGFTSMGVHGSTGIPFIGFHENNPRAAGTTPNVYFDIEAGIGAFVADAPMSLPNSGGNTVDAIWPRVAIGRNGSVHAVVTENTVNAGDPNRQFYHRGMYDPLASMITWSPSVELPGITENIAAEVTASRLSNKAAVAWMRPTTLDHSPGTPTIQVDNNVVVVQSLDGLTWNFNNYQYVTNWRQPNPALLPDTTAANGDTFRSYNDITAMYDRNDLLHIMHTTGLYYRWDFHQRDSLGIPIPSDSSFYVWGHIWHWREDQPANLVMAVNGGDFWQDIYANPGAWNRTAHRPSLTQDWATGYLYCVYAAHYDPRDSTLAQDVSLAGECNFDIFVTVSTNGGMNWAYGTNITNTRTPNSPIGQGRSEHWPSANRWVDNYVHITYVTDYDAGWIFQTEGGWTNNDYNYHRVPKQLIPSTPLIPVVSVNEPIRDVSVSVPSGFELLGNYPNPFNPTTEIQFSLDRQMEIELAIYDVSGRQVAMLAKSKLNAGRYAVSFDAKHLPSGVYFAKLTSGNTASVKKMTLLK